MLISRSHIGFVRPPTPKRMRIFLSFMILAREMVDAMDAPPTPDLVRESVLEIWAVYYELGTVVSHHQLSYP